MSGPARPKKTLLLHTFNSDPRGVFFPAKFNLLSLFSYLKTRGLEAEVLDLEVELGRPGTEQELAAFFSRARTLIDAKEFDIAAISCYTSHDYRHAVRLGRLVRSLRPDAVIVTGGYHPSGVPEDFTPADTPFDFAITGEAETALADLASGRARPSPGAAKTLAGRPVSLTDDTVYLFESYPYAHLPSPIYPLVLSRGCPFQCAYCVEPAIGAGYRVFSVQKSLSLLEQVLAVVKPKAIALHDPIFGFPKTWRREFLSALIRRKIRVQLGIEVRIDMLDQEDIDLVSRLDVINHVGAETASPRMVRIMRKAANPELYLSKIDEVLSYASKREALFGVNMIFNHPGETPRTFEETLSYFEALRAGLPRTSFLLHPFQYQFFPGSPEFIAISDYERDYGTRVLNKRWWKTTRLGEDSGSTAVIASREMERAFGPDPFYWKTPVRQLNERILERASAKQKLAVCWWASAHQEADNVLRRQRKAVAA